MSDLEARRKSVYLLYPPGLDEGELLHVRRLLVQALQARRGQVDQYRRLVSALLLHLRTEVIIITINIITIIIIRHYLQTELLRLDLEHLGVDLAGPEGPDELWADVGRVAHVRPRDVEQGGQLGTLDLHGVNKIIKKRLKNVDQERSVRPTCTLMFWAGLASFGVTTVLRHYGSKSA